MKRFKFYALPALIIFASTTFLFAAPTDFGVWIASLSETGSLPGTHTLYTLDSGVSKKMTTVVATANTASSLVARDGSGNFAAGTITAALTGNASTATALASNPADCSAGQYATTIAASGALTCAQVDYTQVSGLGTLATQSGTFSGTSSGTNTGDQTTITGNAGTATALAANPTDCSSNQFATTIAANGNLTCAALTDADVPDALTISGGTVNNTVIGGVTPAAGTFTSVVGTTGQFGDLYSSTTIYGFSIEASTELLHGANVLGGSGNPMLIDSELSAMNGGDAFTSLNIAITNANHTGSSNYIQAINIADITQDAEASETAIKIGEGWDSAINAGYGVITAGVFKNPDSNFLVDDSGALLANSIETGSLTITAGSLNANSHNITNVLNLDASQIDVGQINASAGNFSGGDVTGIGGLYGDSLEFSHAYIEGRYRFKTASSTASANNLTLPVDGDTIPITGTTQINLINSTGLSAGDHFTLKFVSAGDTVKHGQATSGANKSIKNTGSVDYVSTVGSELHVMYDGTNFYTTPGYYP